MTSATYNRTTELLCKLLDERGIKWKDGGAAYEIEWSTPDGRHCSAMYWKPTFTVLVSGCTPEQAIAATLDGWKLTAEQVRKAIKKYAEDDSCYIFEVYGEMCGPIADELNAALGSGTCRIIASSTDGLCSDNPRQWFKLSCGHSFMLYGLGVPVACAVCGKRVSA